MNTHFDQLWIHCFYYLCPREVSNVSAVSRTLRFFANNAVLWDSFIEPLWKSKIYISDTAQQLRRINPRIAYYFGLTDATRSFITVEELKDFLWRFRFKEAAGDDWTSLCPWNQGYPAIRLKFETDPQEIKYEVDSSPAFSAMNEGISIRWQLKWRSTSLKFQKPVHRFLNAVRNYITMATRPTLEDGQNISGRAAGELLSAYADRVRLGLNSLDGSVGDTILLNVTELVPPYLISRSPTDNWGFIAESCWAIYASWELPLKHDCRLLEDDFLHVSVFDQAREVDYYNRRVSARMR